MFKKIMMLILIAYMFTFLKPINASALTSKTKISDSFTIKIQDNPLNASIQGNSVKIFPKLYTPIVDSINALKPLVEASLENRENNFSIQYKGNTNNLSSELDSMLNDIFANDDYLNFSMSSLNVNYSGYENDLTINFGFEYISVNGTHQITKAEEDFVSSEITRILSLIITTNMDDLAKEKAIHDYIVSNIGYDTTLTEHSAYAALYYGKTVCQGYSLLAYRMLNQAGVKTRIIKGNVDIGAHAWNLVQINGCWYHLDCTWDDPIPDKPERVLYNYYNLLDDEIDETHTWDKSLYPATNDVSEITPIEILMGDINNDKKVTAEDATLVLRHIVGLIVLNEKQISAADLNNDGKITAGDATLILRKVVDL